MFVKKLSSVVEYRLRPRSSLCEDADQTIFVHGCHGACYQKKPCSQHPTRQRYRFEKGRLTPPTRSQEGFALLWGVGQSPTSHSTMCFYAIKTRTVGGKQSKEQE